MLFNFIGCPQSGKTTTAAMVFASMKETGIVAEFIPEQARYYIAKLRVQKNLLPEEKLILNDSNQIEIMKHQVEMDEILVKACGDRVIILSDSSPLNAMLYMSFTCRRSKEVQDLALRSLVITKTSFWAHPIYRPYQQDPNRIHSEEESKSIDKRIPELVSEFPTLNVVNIHGTTSERLLIVQDRIYFSR